MDREFDIHLALEVEEQLDAGVPLRDARLAARREFGSVTLTKEEVRDMWFSTIKSGFDSPYRYQLPTLPPSVGSRSYLDDATRP
jgi:hypothetical protein